MVDFCAASTFMAIATSASKCPDITFFPCRAVVLGRGFWPRSGFCGAVIRCPLLYLPLIVCAEPIRPAQCQL